MIKKFDTVYWSITVSLTNSGVNQGQVISDIDKQGGVLIALTSAIGTDQPVVYRMVTDLRLAP